MFGVEWFFDLENCPTDEAVLVRYEDGAIRLVDTNEGRSVWGECQWVKPPKDLGIHSPIAWGRAADAYDYDGIEVSNAARVITMEQYRTWLSQEYVRASSDVGLSTKDRRTRMDKLRAAVEVIEEDWGFRFWQYHSERPEACTGRLCDGVF
ncbi:MAG: hypothetical protein ACWA40_07430 [Planktomarina sp.]